MSVSLLKNKVVDLSKKAKIEIDKLPLSNTSAQVVLVLDISKSMNRLYKNGVVQNLVQRILGLAMNLDDDGCIDVILFGTRAYNIKSATIDNLDGYVDREITSKYRIVEATRYSEALNVIKDKYQNAKGDPVFVVFVTDGNNSDKRDTTNLITELSHSPFFFQFVGIGQETFPYLNKLDDLPGRFIDNAGFIKVEDIDSLDDHQLYSGLLNEFPDWIKEAKRKGLI